MNSGAALPQKVCTTCGTRYPADALYCPSDGTPLKSAHAGDAFDSAPDAPDPYLGREISGHIEIRQLAGVGAMGRVYRAFQKGIDRDVAVKVLHRELSANAQLVQRFHREAKVASRLSHPNVVQVHLAGQLPDGAMYIVMEYLDGLSLQSALAASAGAMPLSRVLHIIVQLCDAVGEAHAQSVVHRDLKPDNVMLIHRGGDPDCVKVLDFGIARLNWGEQSMATAAGLIFGTARYISPEGAQGETVGPQGDVYAIATLMFQMLAGRTPFEGDQAVALLVQQIHDAPPHIRTIPRASYVPEAITDVIMQNLTKDPSARAPDARAFGRAIIDAAKVSGLSPEEILSRPMMMGGARSSAPVRLPSMQQTKQLQLSPEAAAMIATPPAQANPPSSSRPVAAATPAPEESRPILGNATTKWTPPVGFEARLRPGGVDRTLDDADETPPPPRSSSRVPASPSSSPHLSPPQPGGAGTTQFTPPLPEVAHRPSYSAPHSIPFAGAQTAESTLDDDDLQARPSQPLRSRPTTSMHDADFVSPRRSRSRGIAIVFLCFVLGGAIAAVVAYRLGNLGPMAMSGTLTESVTRANDALRQRRWDTPPNDNVRDITNIALTKWPRDPQLMDIRAHATDELVKEAVGRKFSGDLAAALHLARLARELDPTDTTAQQLVVEYENETATVASALPLPIPSAQPSSSTAHAVATPPLTSNATSSVTSNGARVTFDADPLKPRIGQTVLFVAKVANGKSVPNDPHFEITMAGHTTRLNALLDGGAYRSAFTFLEAGKYDVVFVTKVDNVNLRAARVILAGDLSKSQPQEPMLPPDPEPKTAPSASVKWL